MNWHGFVPPFFHQQQENYDVEVDTSIEDITTCVKRIPAALLAKNKSTCATQS